MLRGEIYPGSLEENLLISFLKRKDEFLLSLAIIIAQAAITTKEASDAVNNLIGQIRANFIHGDQTQMTAERRRELAQKLISQLPLTPKGTIDKTIFQGPKTEQQKPVQKKLEKKIRLKP
jgi:hypothetical protein